MALRSMALRNIALLTLLMMDSFLEGGFPSDAQYIVQLGGHVNRQSEKIFLTCLIT